jgi:ABC-type transport system involved in multi-copper enzyme maturation permease subunit
MLIHFLSFEVRYWLRSWMLWIFLLIIALLVFGATATDQVTIGQALENTYRNAPFVIENYYSILGLLTLLMTVAFVNSAASREFAYNTHQILFATPLKKFDYLAGRFLGSALIAVIPMLGVSVGIIVGKWMPWVDPERWGPVNWTAHLYGILVFAIPNTLFVSAIIFAIAILTRSTVTSFIGGLVLLTGYGVGQALSTDVQHETWAALLDPFGIRTFALATKYWTVAEKNTLTIGYSGLLLWNRLIWLAVAAAIFAFAYSRFRFEERAGRGRKVRDDVEQAAAVAINLPAVRQAFGLGAQWAQFRGSFKVEFLGLVKSTSFIVITCAALLNVIPSLILSASEGYGNTSFPVTYRLIEIIQGSLYMFLIGMLTYYAGTLVWKERDARMDEIEDALPHRDWPSYASKLSALLCTIFLIVCLAMVTGILAQAFSGYHRYQFGLWTTELLLMDFTTFIFLTALAYFIHVISPNKYIGYFAFIAFVIANQFAWRPLHVATRLVQFGSQPDTTYSDFFGFAPYWKSWTWFTVYWLAFCGLLAVASVLLWQRGRERAWRVRLRNARLRFTVPLRVLAFALLALFLGTGAWIYYNTKVLNTILSEDDRDRMAADYEKTYKKYDKLPQPRVIDLKYAIDLYPERRAATMRADTIIQNKTDKPIAVLHLNDAGPDYRTQVQIDGATLKQRDPRLQYSIYEFDPPMQPGEQRHFRFTVKREPRGFENTVSVLQVVQNGTFFNNADVSPQIGYQPGRELDNRNKRKKFGLKEKDPMPALERNCTADCMDTYLSNNSDWVNVETVISTSPGQTAVAPGSLERQWTENGRCYFKYKLDHSSVNFYSFLSANYVVARKEWNGIKIEVYYLKEQPWNVPKMLRSVEKSFEYYTANFGPYPQKEARIIEFPRIAAFAQAFPGTMPYSESIGFIANLKDPEDIDMVYYVVAHEMGHQWWAHQLIGANMQGATLLSETLAQYSALMVMEKEYGRDKMRKFLKYEMDNYLRSRGKELLKERPLLRVDSNQGYVHYRKGSVVMYYLKEMIGEEAVNRALRKVLQQYAYAPPPYPVSYALVDALREETPPQYQYLIQDLFYDITLFSNRTLSATAKKRADGKYDVTIHVDAKKFKADEKGEEREVPVNDWIDIGAFAKPPKGKKYGKTLYRDRVLMKSGAATYTFTVDEAPDKAGIDPFLLLIDRIPDDNTKTVEIAG